MKLFKLIRFWQQVSAKNGLSLLFQPHLTQQFPSLPELSFSLGKDNLQKMKPDKAFSTIGTFFAHTVSSLHDQILLILFKKQLPTLPTTLYRFLSASLLLVQFFSFNMLEIFRFIISSCLLSVWYSDTQERNFVYSAHWIILEKRAK